MDDLDQKLKAIVEVLNLLRSWHTTHLDKDHADLDAEIAKLRKRITRLEKASGIYEPIADIEIIETQKPHRKPKAASKAASKANTNTNEVNTNEANTWRL